MTTFAPYIKLLRSQKHLVVAFVIAIALLTGMIVAQDDGREQASKQVQADTRSGLRLMVAKLEAQRATFEVMAQSYTDLLDDHPYNRELIREILKGSMNRLDSLDRVAVAITTRDSAGRPVIHNFHVLSRESVPTHLSLTSEGELAALLPYRTAVRERGVPMWIERTMTADGACNTLVYVVPIWQQLGPRRVFRGVLEFDLCVDKVLANLEGTELGDGVFPLILSKGGRLVSAGTTDAPSGGATFPLFSETALEQASLGVREVDDPFLGGTSWIRAERLANLNWTIVAGVNEASLGKPRNRLRNGILVMEFLALLLLLYVTLYNDSQKRSVRFREQLASLLEPSDTPAANVGSDSHPEIDSAVRLVSESMNQLHQVIADQKRALSETEAATKKIQANLEMARKTQQSFLPHTFPPFPDHEEIDIYASIDEADDVGGDLYDYFFIDDHRLLVVIGDVSEKGFAAALYMAAASTLFKNIASTLKSPDQILTHVNRQLCSQNTSNMFATVLCGILDLRTGSFTYSNAGHPRPILIDGDNVEPMPVPDGFLLGLFEEAEFNTITTTLNPGATVFLYTDGVTEAQDPNEVLFGETRLLKQLRSKNWRGPAEIVRCTRRRLAIFTEGSNHADDVAMVALTFHQPSKGNRSWNSTLTKHRTISTSRHQVASKPSPSKRLKKRFDAGPTPARTLS